MFFGRWRKQNTPTIPFRMLVMKNNQTCVYITIRMLLDRGKQAINHLPNFFPYTPFLWILPIRFVQWEISFVDLRAWVYVDVSFVVSFELTNPNTLFNVPVSIYRIDFILLLSSIFDYIFCVFLLLINVSRKCLSTDCIAKRKFNFYYWEICICCYS